MANPTGGKRPGRPSGPSDARKRILDSARELFARNGSKNTSIRSIAAAADVDSALVHHYFGTKQQLLAAAVDIPLDPQAVLTVLLATPVEQLGSTIAGLILPLWESELGVHLKATLRSAIAGDTIAMYGTFLREVVLQEIASRIDDPPGTGILRAEFAATQMLGVIMARHIFGLQPFATLPIEQVIDIVAPNLQRYLTGELPQLG